MINLVKSGLVILVCILVSGVARAQMVKDNSKWTFEAKKMKQGNYEIVAHLKLEKGWHVYSQKPGGDGTLIPVEIKIEKNDKVKFSGKIHEKGKLISEKVEGIEGKVNMFKDRVDYIQAAFISGATTIKGTYMYQMCSDKMCLPPTTKDFTIEVK